jgi:hypothetical protein
MRSGWVRIKLDPHPLQSDGDASLDLLPSVVLYRFGV